MLLHDTGRGLPVDSSSLVQIMQELTHKMTTREHAMFYLFLSLPNHFINQKSNAHAYTELAMVE